ncbi:MAG: DUF393 domain-containing protein [Chthoniobacterales bacterium]
MKKLFVLYDAECALCRRCREFLSRQPSYIPLEFVPLQTLDLEQRFPGITALHPDREIIVISDEGQVYQGGHAWIMCLYALREYREWSQRLASPALLPFAKKIVSSISQNRHFLSRWLFKPDAELTNRLAHAPVECACDR